MDAAVTAAAAAMASPNASTNTPISPDMQQHHDHARASIETAGKLAHALTPPTSEEMNKKDSDDSELSDLDLDELDEDDEDDEEILPDHYWDGGRVPVFKPTMDQFKSFKRFMSKIDKYGMKSGIVKVIPPQEWRDALPALDDHVKRIRIKNPITQEFNGTFGTYTQQNVEKQRSYNLPEWKALTEETQHQPPAKRGERRKNQEKISRVVAANARGRAAAAMPAAPSQSDAPAVAKRKPGRPRRRPLPGEENDVPAEVSSGRRDSRASATAAPDPAQAKTADKKTGKPRGRPAKGGAAGQGQAKSVTSRRLNNTAEAAEYIDEAAFQEFDYRMDGLDEFTPERCAELETQYWKSLAFNQPMYAADMPGSLFDDTCDTWNVAKLPNLLDVLGTKVPGVNTAYLYMGMWKATFAWHLEDVDLYSINYIHFGAPKQWYSISQEDARKFEAAMKSNWPVDAKNCDQFLRHKTYLISPDVLQKQHRVTVNKLVHYEGEFVITFPYGYHSGYNIGYNCAESVNFATDSWLEYGRIAKKCNCEADNVWVDVYEIERKLRGEPTPEYIEETDDDDEDLSDVEDASLPTPPASVKGKSQRGRKRKRDVKDEKGRPKKRKIRIKIRVSTRQPCAMCPNENPWEPLLPSDTGKKVHRCCALYTPETWIEKDEAGHETVRGVGSIDRARLDLKCNFCRSKRGACFQCSSKKCTRAFHATCAMAAGVLVDAGMVPTFGEDGTEYYEEGYDFRCRYHRPKQPKNLSVEALENSKRLVAYGKELKHNDVIQAQYLGAEVFAGLVVENRPAEFSVLVEVLPEGELVEVEYKYITLFDPNDSVRLKPSLNAIPMPAGMNKKQVSANNRRDGVPTQGQCFHDDEAYKFQDFYSIDTPPQGYVAKRLQTIARLNINFDLPNQLFFYLPKLSTDTKCAFTDQVGGQTPSSNANFLERVGSARVTSSTRPGYSSSATKMSLTRSPSLKIIPKAFTNNGLAQVRPQSTITPAVIMNDRPYTYKPRDSGSPNNNWGIDPQALATQRSLLAEADRRASTHSLSQSKPQTPHTMYSPGDSTLAAAPSRNFPRSQYYSIQTLPAAFPGDYSGFRQAAGLQPRAAALDMFVPDYDAVTVQPPSQQDSEGCSTPAPVSLVGSSDNAGTGVSRPTSSAQSHHSPSGAPLTPATTISSASKEWETTPGYLENLKKYPYLLNSYLRREKVYVSPYNAEGGFSSAYQPLSLDKVPTEKKRVRTPSASSTSEASKPWTPPSEVWHRAGLSKQRSFSDAHTPPPPIFYAHPPKHSYSHSMPQTAWQSPYDIHQTFTHGLMHSSSRDILDTSLLRDSRYGFGGSFTLPDFATSHRNDYGVATYSTPSLWPSPKAPTPSSLATLPVSSAIQPSALVGLSTSQNRAWGLFPKLGGETMQRVSSAGYGPMLPQMGALNDP